MSINLSINLKRANKIYHEGETIAGVVVVEAAGGEVRHEGLSLLMEGSVNLQLSPKHAGLLDAFSNNIKDVGLSKVLSILPKYLQNRCVEIVHVEDDIQRSEHDPITLMNTSLELAAAGRIPGGVTEIPFELPLRARGAAPLLESYHGVFVSVMYALRCTLRRPLFSKPLHASAQFFVQYRHSGAPPPRPVSCELSPGAPRPRLRVLVELASTVCPLDQPITGKIRVEHCEVPIKSIELQLVRVETCGSAEGFTRDATEIQNIQLAEGDPPRGRALALRMRLPRLFTCPTTATPHFKIEFELNIAIIFEDDHLITENFPILLLRCR